jgi:hypothetical protein
LNEIEMQAIERIGVSQCLVGQQEGDVLEPVELVEFLREALQPAI